MDERQAKFMKDSVGIYWDVDTIARMLQDLGETALYEKAMELNHAIYVRRQEIKAQNNGDN